MKHEKEWHTCDRCGAEIENENRSTFLKKCYRISGLFVKKPLYLKLLILIYALSVAKILRGL